MATTIEQQQVGVPVAGPRIGAPLIALAAVALAAVLIAGSMVLRSSGERTSLSAPSERPIFTQDELTVLDLVAREVLPGDVLKAEPFRTKLLVAQGILPLATLDAAIPAPLYCPDEIATLQKVAAGTLPASTLDREPFLTKNLIAQGLIPRGSVGC